MHLADHEEYKEKFELFISFEENTSFGVEFRKVLGHQFEALGVLEEHTSYRMNEISGWAFFSVRSEQDGDPNWKPNVKEYIVERIMELVTYWKENGEAYPTQEPLTGIEIQKNVEVDCIYHYDDISRYE